MKLVIFLGNPGLKYRSTRHNIGFMVGDYLVKQLKLKWKMDKKFSAELAVIARSETTKQSRTGSLRFAREDKIILAKPQLFYNLTGESVQKLFNFYKINNSELLVVCDDFNLEFGKLRFREKGSDGGNNGLKSISNHLGEDFARLRIGTGSEMRKIMGDTDFVLSKFTQEEREKVPELFEQVISKINEFIQK